MISARIRTATSHDREDVRDVHVRAFPAAESQLVATLAVDLLGEATEPETISLVAEVDGKVVGHIAFSPVRADTRQNWLGYILAPLGVKPGYQRQGIGSKLVECGMALLSGKRVDVLFVYGDPKYYGRFGFSANAATRFIPPCELKYPFGWLACMLREGNPDDQAVRLSCVRSLYNPALW